MSTYIDGICASQNLDSSGEVVDIAGLDISSLSVDGTLNWEHLKDLPMQVVGKILKAKKIFSDVDCEDDRELHYWNKCKTPFVYIVGELFDDYVESAKHVAGLFKYDADKRGQNQKDVLGFSVEGAKINKEGNVITHSIARKCTVTQLPCNKQAVAEIVPTKSEKKKDNIDELFKTESVEIELLKNEDKSRLLEMLKNQDPKKHASKLGIDPMEKDDGLSLGGASSALSGVGPSSPSLMGSEKANMKKTQPKLSIVKPPNPNGKEIGKTKSGKSVFSEGKIHQYSGFSGADHRDAAGLHAERGNSAKASLHMQAAGTAERKENRFAEGKKQKQSKASPSIPPKSNADKLFHPELSGKVKPPGPIKKALKFDHPKGYVPSSVPKKEESKIPKYADPKKEFKGTFDTEVGHVEPHHSSDGPDAVYLKTGHVSHGHKKGKFKIGDKVTATQHIQGTHILEHKDIKKALDAGSGMSAPGSMVGGSSLVSESLSSTMVGSGKIKPPKIARPDRGYGKIIDANKPPAPPKNPMKPFGSVSIRGEKSQMLMRAEQEYAKWEKREQFEQFMAKRMPHLTKHEIKAIGQTMALNKAMTLEKALSKTYMSSYIAKKDK